MVSNKTPCRVIYGDTDTMGMAYHANYFRWFEIGRTEMFRALGLSYKTIEENGLFLPVSEAQCKYIAPARYDDVLMIETTLDGGIRAGIKFNYRLVCKEDKRLLAQGYTKHACVNSDGKVIRPPRFLAKLVTENS